MGVLNTTPAIWTAGEKVTAAKMTTEVHDALTNLQGAWVAYTPTLGGMTLGNGTIAGRYNQVGKTIVAQVILSAGSTTTYSGTITVSLPATPQNATASIPVGNVFAANGSNATRQTAVAILNGAPSVYLLGQGTNTVWSNTVPFTWGTSAVLNLVVTYEAA